MKKKILLLILAIISITTLTSCNKQIFDLNYKFDKVHLHQEGKCYEIDKWNDYEGEQLQVILKDGTVLLVSNVNADLINGNCPYCDDDN